jgi:hypothetical protein
MFAPSKAMPNGPPNMDIVARNGHVHAKCFEDIYLRGIGRAWLLILAKCIDGEAPLTAWGICAVPADRHCRAGSKGGSRSIRRKSAVVERELRRISLMIPSGVKPRATPIERARARGGGVKDRDDGLCAMVRHNCLRLPMVSLKAIDTLGKFLTTWIKLVLGRLSVRISEAD